jgi:uncharacterized protein (DUF1697 family)
MNLFKWLFSFKTIEKFDLNTKEKKVCEVKPSKPPEPTFEEKRETLLKNNIGKHIILYKVKTTQAIITRNPVYAYTQDAAGYRYISHYEDETHSEVASAETIEGTLQDATISMIKVDDKWYVFGYEPEKIYEYNIILK